MTITDALFHREVKWDKTVRYEEQASKHGSSDEEELAKMMHRSKHDSKS